MLISKIFGLWISSTLNLELRNGKKYGDLNNLLAHIDKTDQKFGELKASFSQ